MRTILVADDYPGMRRLLSGILRREGFRVVTVSSASGLLKKWKALRCRVVLSDIEMPGELDGIQACRDIRRMAPNVKAFLMTGDSRGRERARRSGFQIAFLKPFTLEAVRRWARRVG